MFDDLGKLKDAAEGLRDDIDQYVPQILAVWERTVAVAEKLVDESKRLDDRGAEITELWRKDAGPTFRKIADELAYMRQILAQVSKTAGGVGVATALLGGLAERLKHGGKKGK